MDVLEFHIGFLGLKMACFCCAGWISPSSGCGVHQQPHFTGLKCKYRLANLGTVFDFLLWDLSWAPPRAGNRRRPCLGKGTPKPWSLSPCNDSMAQSLFPLRTLQFPCPPFERHPAESVWPSQSEGSSGSIRQYSGAHVLTESMRASEHTASHPD
jgi:hypothetical protein